MKAWIVSLLRRLLLWLDPPEFEWPMDLPQIDPLDLMASQLVMRADALTASGEYKRHWVYAQLLKAFPDRRKRDAGLAIELALQAKGDSSWSVRES